MWGMFAKMERMRWEVKGARKQGQKLEWMVQVKPQRAWSLVEEKIVESVFGYEIDQFIAAMKPGDSYSTRTPLSPDRVTMDALFREAPPHSAM